MPELPEVEVVRQFLKDTIVDSTISDLKILEAKSFSGDKDQVIGQKITHLSRIGKQLSIHLSNNLILLVHLKMTGQLIYKNKLSKTILGHPTPKLNNAKLPNKTTRLIFYLAPPSSRGRIKEGVLFFNDQRKFGWIRLLTPNQVKNHQKKLGPDLLSPDFTPDYFYQQFLRSRRPIKSVLHDQDKFAGIGNIYANDALFLSRIYPLLVSNKITRNQAKTLHKNLLKIIRQSIHSGGSTARDNMYIKPDGNPGQNQYNFQVYQRAGEPCLVCQTKINRIKISGRSAFYCPSCQKR